MYVAEQVLERFIAVHFFRKCAVCFQASNRLLCDDFLGGSFWYYSGQCSSGQTASGVSAKSLCSVFLHRNLVGKIAPTVLKHVYHLIVPLHLLGI